MHAHWDSQWKISLFFIILLLFILFIYAFFYFIFLSHYSVIACFNIRLSRMNFHKNKHSTSEIKIMIMANFVFISRLWYFSVSEIQVKLFYLTHQGQA